jgi:type IV fimbrial biogenesis protein FimT
MKLPASIAHLRGFTLIELMVVISIAAIMAMIGVPALQGTLNDFRQRGAASLLVSDLNLARAEAIKRNSRVLMCVRNTAGTGCGTSSNWLTGWVICTDSDASGVCDTGTASSPNPLVVRSPLDAVLTLSVTDAAAAAVSVIRFNANATQGGGSSAIAFRLSGTWTSPTTDTITVAGTGNISKR